MKYLIYILLILGIGGCENDRQLYDGEVNDVSGIYFRYFSRTLNGVEVWQDSLLFSFQNILPDIKEYSLIVLMHRKEHLRAA
mgnify:CR=1 FL=1